MALPDLFSRRKRQASSAGVEVYQYDEIPKGFRVQFLQILGEALGHYENDEWNGTQTGAVAVYNELVLVMRKERQVFSLTGQGGSVTSKEEFRRWFFEETDLDGVLDGLELCCRMLAGVVTTHAHEFRDARSSGKEAIEELNARLKEAGIGYQFASGQLVRVDSQHLHSDVIVPALLLLSQSRFATADSEFRTAHAAYRARDYEGCLLHCGKAFESVLKIIGKARGWQISENDNAAKLINAAFASGFVPTALQAEFTALRSLLESGVPVLRNKMSGHGAGASPRTVPEHFAAFQLHQTAAVLVFLAEQDATA